MNSILAAVAAIVTASTAFALESATPSTTPAVSLVTTDRLASATPPAAREWFSIDAEGHAVHHLDFTEATLIVAQPNGLASATAPVVREWFSVDAEGVPVQHFDFTEATLIIARPAQVASATAPTPAKYRPSRDLLAPTLADR